MMHNTEAASSAPVFECISGKSLKDVALELWLKRKARVRVAKKYQKKLQRSATAKNN